MANIDNDPMYMRISAMLEGLCNRIDEEVNVQEKQLEASKRNNELETRFAQELQLNRELQARLDAAARRGGELARVCEQFQLKLNITDSDRTRLNTAKEMYQIAKELTGIRWDFTAPPNVAKGYVKSESRKLLEPFSITLDEAAGAAGAAGAGGAGAAGDELWARVAGAAHPAWRVHDKENCHPNNM